MEKIINWVELSLKLAGNETSISRNRIPKKYQSKINSLIEHLEEWEKQQIKQNKMMSKLNTQFGVAVTSDFSERTWTFEIPKKFSVSAGEFAILPKDKYERLITALKGIRNSMNVHPDCTEESEFADMVSRCDESIEECGS